MQLKDQQYYQAMHDRVVAQHSNFITGTTCTIEQVLNTTVICIRYPGMEKFAVIKDVYDDQAIEHLMLQAVETLYLLDQKDKTEAYDRAIKIVPKGF